MIASDHAADTSLYLYRPNAGVSATENSNIFGNELLRAPRQTAATRRNLAHAHIEWMNEPYGHSCRKLDQAIWVVASASDRLMTNVVDELVSLMAMMVNFNGLSSELS